MNTCPHCSSDQYSVNVTCANCGVIYKALPNWAGLTDEEIQKMRHLIDWTAGWSYNTFARAVEAKLKEKNT